MIDPAAMMGAPQAPPEEEGPGDVTDIIREALDLVRQYADQEQDEQNILLAEKISTQLQTILANEEKDQMGMLQGKASPRLLKQAYGANG
jgi:uncharacterized protein YqeY